MKEVIASPKQSRNAIHSDGGYGEPGEPPTFLKEKRFGLSIRRYVL